MLLLLMLLLLLQQQQLLLLLLLLLLIIIIIIIEADHSLTIKDIFIYIFYMFRAPMCPSSRELLYNAITGLSFCVDGCLVCRSIPDGHLHRMTNNSLDDGHMAARNMQKIEINMSLIVSEWSDSIIIIIISSSSSSNTEAWYAEAYAPAYQTANYTEFHKPGVALIQ